MSCIVSGSGKSLFRAANDKGYYTITNVPAGTYKLKAWHERLPSQRRHYRNRVRRKIKVDSRSASSICQTLIMEKLRTTLQVSSAPK